MHVHHRQQAAEALAEYSEAKIPTSALLLVLANAIATMLSADLASPVTILIGTTPITREPAEPALRQRR
jgi:hypothetical protein